MFKNFLFVLFTQHKIKSFSLCVVVCVCVYGGGCVRACGFKLGDNSKKVFLGLKIVKRCYVSMLCK